MEAALSRYSEHHTFFIALKSDTTFDKRFFFLNVTAFDDLKIKLLAHVYIWFR